MLKLPDIVEFARRIALWTVRTQGAALASRHGLPALVARLRGLADDASAADIHSAVDDLCTAMGEESWRATDIRSAARCASPGHDATDRRATALFVAAGAGPRSRRFGDALVAAWTGAGGDVEPLRRPGINQTLVERAAKCGLKMGAWHCGSAHCIAGWYSTLSGHPELERSVGCELAATLVFAVNNPGERLPYFGQSQAAGERELERLDDLNRVSAHAPA